jgi:hypothetical protein
MATTRVLETPEADIAYDVHGPAPADSAQPPLVVVGQPMAADGFGTLAAYFPERMVVTYDPRGIGCVEHEPDVQARDVHAVIGALGGGAVDVFGQRGRRDRARARGRSSGRRADPRGARAAVVLRRSRRRGRRTGQEWSWAVSGYRPDVAALAAASSRVVIAVGEESLTVFTGRTAVATAELLGQRATVFPSHHGGFLGGDFGYAGQPEAFAARLRGVLGREAAGESGKRG